MAKAQEKGRKKCILREKQVQGGFLSFVCVYACFLGKYRRREVGAGMVEDYEKAGWGQIIKDVLMPC